MDSENLLDLAHEFKRVSRLAVHLVYEGKDRDMAHHTDLEQFDGLRLDTFGSVDDHDSGVRCHQSTVSILGEVLVSGGIKDVDAVSLIIELEYGRCYRDTSLLLDLHPVGDCVLCRFAALYGSGEVDRASV